MNYITTYTGKHFEPLSPDVSLIDIRDIAHALSLMCRGNGHLKSFFSVAQHCINCALEAKERGCSKKVILACLLHDASEAYMSDVPRPFKQFLLDYQRIEENLLDMIYEKFLAEPLNDEEKAIMKQIDDDLLYYDLKELLGEICEGEPPKLNIELDYRFVPFEDVEKRYLELYETLKYVIIV